ncbi:MAG TPA: hypothetical protein PLZ95_21385 [Bryobacteraceae bacterium]|nr:hypothetical protein [Bryobacteraceae bacterium]
MSSIGIGLLLLALQAPGTTLERLSLEEMTATSHIIVRATVLGQTAVQRSSLVYTVYSLRVTERIKGEAANPLQVSVPGGTVGRLRQTFSGSPSLTTGSEYVVFIWRGKSGNLHIIGLSQGLFNLTVNQAGEVVLSRGVLDAQLVDKSGRQVQSQPVALTLDKLRQMVRSTSEAVR